MAIFTTGAYGYSMASNYNKNPKPAVVMTDQGKEKVIVKRQSYEEIIEDEKKGEEERSEIISKNL